MSLADALSEPFSSTPDRAAIIRTLFTRGMDKNSRNRVRPSQPEATQEVKPKHKSSKRHHNLKHRKNTCKEAAKSDDSSDSESEDSTASESESSDESSSEDEKQRRAKRKDRKSRKRHDSGSASDKTSSKKKKACDVSDSAQSEADTEDSLDDLLARLGSNLMHKVKASKHRRQPSKSKTKSKRKLEKTESEVFKRVDQVWDKEMHHYKLKASTEVDDSEFAEHAFLVRRRLDYDNQYSSTIVDIKSKVLRSALAVVMKECKSVSLEAEEPCIDPNVLFLYVEQIRTYYKKTLKAQIKTEKKRKVIKRLETQRAQCKALVGYIDTDYANTKKTLHPLLAAGNITFDLCWALFEPNDIAITSTYGNWDEPRCFKVDYANKHKSMANGEWYEIEGRYLEHDGKHFGLGDFECNIKSFHGPRKISSLACYPLRYHQDPEGVRKQIIERGRRFVALEGMNYRLHTGMAFHKKKKQMIRININGRVMVDPATFRRINPNYQITVVKAIEFNEDLRSMTDYSDSCSGSSSEDDDNKAEQLDQKTSDTDEPKVKYKYVKDESGNYQDVAVVVDEDGNPLRSQQIHALQEQTFTEDDLLLTSSVVLGFAFSEKLWLEFTLSGVREIEYNENAFDSLVLPPNQKSIVRALVESHRFHGAKAIDDVIHGKGKGLVAVLHGPPGTGKTLTAEGISELLKSPLYMVSAGELGTDPSKLELRLQEILDIAHSWGAILLLDEADVFLEKREIHDIHRNALVSIFLRLLEYFQGILFLTTNRVETFDDAFQSRIHLALRYGDLTPKAKKTVWKMFLDLCKAGGEVQDMSESDLDALSRHQLNGRQIKNAVRTAQALALNEKETLTLSHIKRVLDVAETFDRDLKGGTGYIEAMRSYT